MKGIFLVWERQKVRRAAYSKRVSHRTGRRGGARDPKGLGGKESYVGLKRGGVPVGK